MVGDLPSFGPVWYNEGSLAHIISFATVRKICHITMDTLAEAAIIVYKHNGDQLKFMEGCASQYYYDAKPSNTQLTDYTLVQSVTKNKSLYTSQQVASAKLAKRGYKLVGDRSHATFLKMIREHQLHNSPITMNDANRAQKIYSCDLATLRGRTSRTTPVHVPSDQLCPLQSSILDAHKHVTLFDILLSTVSCSLARFHDTSISLPVEHIQTRALLKHVLPSLKKVNNIYKACGFQIEMMHERRISESPRPNPQTRQHPVKYCSNQQTRP
jgi:hypothetical protein